MTDVAEIKRALSDPARACAALRLSEGSTRQARGLHIRCPVCGGGKDTPPCSVRVGGDGTIAVKCFSCDFSGDVLSLVAVAHGLDPRGDFRRVKEIAAEIAGLSPDATSGAGARFARVHVEIHDPQPARTHPMDAAEWWTRCLPVTSSPIAIEYLRGRALDSDLVAHLDLARVLRSDAVPSWGRFAGRTWRDTGHALIVPAFDAQGVLRSVRASRIVDGDTPKRLAPAGHTCAGLVFGNPIARGLLSNPDGAAEDMRRAAGEVRVVVAEGEPDFLTFATAPAWRGWAVLGIFSGSWTPELAARLPAGARFVIATDADVAGERYAAEILETLGSRVQGERLVMELDPR